VSTCIPEEDAYVAPMRRRRLFIRRRRQADRETSRAATTRFSLRRLVRVFLKNEKYVMYS